MLFGSAPLDAEDVGEAAVPGLQGHEQHPGSGLPCCVKSCGP